MKLERESQTGYSIHSPGIEDLDDLYIAHADDEFTMTAIVQVVKSNDFLSDNYGVEYCFKVLQCSRTEYLGDLCILVSDFKLTKIENHITK